MAEKTDAWPYDAVQDDPLTALRIPVTESHPRRRYLAAFHGVPTRYLDPEVLARPTDAEAAILASYIDYVRQRYPERWQLQMLAEPLDAIEGHNTFVFHKYGENDWGYRWDTWAHPRFSPSPRHPERRTLVEAIGHSRSFAGDPDRAWEAWKAAHPDVFGPTPGRNRGEAS